MQLTIDTVDAFIKDRAEIIVKDDLDRDLIPVLAFDIDMIGHDFADDSTTTETTEETLNDN